MSKLIIHRILVLTFAFTWGTLRAGAPGLAAEKLVGLQSAPSIAMAVPVVRRGSAALSQIRSRFSTGLYRLVGHRDRSNERRQRQRGHCRRRRADPRLLERQYRFCFHRFGEKCSYP